MTDRSSAPQRPQSGAGLAVWLDYLEALHPVEIDMGLDRVLLVLQKLFPRRPRPRVITVAGTNGKGSTAACIEALLLDAGRKVGVYSSPHLLKYNERVRLNGRDACDADLVAAFERVEAARGSVSLTYFEFGTLAAFAAMAAAGMEDWVLEVGLGGRLDAVNVWDADLAIITSIDLDHTAWLGDNREDIGFEKAGILRVGKPAIYGELNPPKSVMQQVAAQRIPLRRLGEHYRLEQSGDRVIYLSDEPVAAVSVEGSPLPAASLGMAVEAARLLLPGMSEERIAQVLAAVSLPGRFQTLSQQPLVIADVGHNPHAAHWLAGRLQGAAVKGATRVVYAALEDKDVTGVVAAMAPATNHWYLAGLDVPRGLAVEVLKTRAGLEPDALTGCYASVSQAIEAALADMAPDDRLLIFGSFFTVAAAQTYFLKTR
ncbi:MAG: bifunctional tetrahydrofolate synthase/dihydrofolate synthase [Marinobacter sp.]|nr:bifunctional tetrahydrofolate synthase/dihydrofolate synthase [Marinobacter sp.]